MSAQSHQPGRRNKGGKREGNKGGPPPPPPTNPKKMRMVIDAVWLKSLTPPCAREEQAHTQYGSLQY